MQTIRIDKVLLHHFKRKSKSQEQKKIKAFITGKMDLLPEPSRNTVWKKGRWSLKWRGEFAEMKGEIRQKNPLLWVEMGALYLFPGLKGKRKVSKIWKWGLLRASLQITRTLSVT